MRGDEDIAPDPGRAAAAPAEVTAMRGRDRSSEPTVRAEPAGVSSDTARRRA